MLMAPNARGVCSMALTSDLTPAELRTLQFASYWVFGYMAGAYRNFDPLAVEEFFSALDAAAGAPGQLTHEVMASVQTDRVRLLAEYEQANRTIASGLCDVAEVLAKMPDDEARMFRDMLLNTIGLRIAIARGPFGRAVTSEDQEKLDITAGMLADPSSAFT